jgi:hypothetical protein
MACVGEHFLAKLRMNGAEAIRGEQWTLICRVHADGGEGGLLFKLGGVFRQRRSQDACIDERAEGTGGQILELFP